MPSLRQRLRSLRHMRRQKSRIRLGAGIERLEDRRLLAVWANPNGGDWMNPSNWQDGIMPSANEPAIIDVPGTPAIFISSGNAIASSITSQEPIVINGGTLTVNGSLNAAAGVSLNGGELVNAVVTQASVVTASSGTLDGVTLNGTLHLPGSDAFVGVRNGLTVNGLVNGSGFRANMRFFGTQSLAGTGTVTWGNSHGVVVMGASDVLTIGAGITINGFHFGVGSGTSLYGDAGTFVNYGRIETSGWLYLHGPNWVNHGTIRSNPGTYLYTQYNFPSTTWSNQPNGRIEIAGAVTTLNGTDWTNHGTIEFQSPITTNVTGTFVNSGSFVLSNGAVLAIPNANANSFPSSSQISGVGTISGNVTNSGTISPGLNAIGTLTINGNYTQSGSGRLNVQVQSANSGGFDQLRVLGTSTLGGTLEVREFGNPSLTTFDIPTVSATSLVGTFGTVDINVPSAPNLQVSYTSNAVRLSLVVQRTEAVWTNPNGGDWADPANWQDGVLPSANLPAVIDVPGSANVFISSGNAVASSVTSQEPIVINGGTLTVNGSLNAAAGISLNGGVVRNARFSSSTTIQSSSGSLEGVTIEGTLNMPFGGSALNIRDGMTLNGQIHASGFATGLRFYGTQTLAGSGRVVWGNSYGAFAMGANDVLTIGAGMTLTGFNFNLGGGTGLYGDLGTVINYGLIEGNVPGGVLSITGSNWINHGIIRSMNGNIFYTNYYSPSSPWTNAGTIQINGSSSTMAGQTWTNQGTIEFQSPITTNVTGTFVNSGSFVLSNGAVLAIPNANANSFPSSSQISGVGTISGNVTNSGTISPGLNATGTLTINGNYTQSGSGRLNVQVQSANSGGFDQLRVLGTSTLGGTLEVREFGNPSLTTFDIPAVSATSLVGTFGTVDINVPSAPNLQVSYTSNAVRLSQTSPPQLLAHYKLNGDVLDATGLHNPFQSSNIVFEPGVIQGAARMGVGGAIDIADSASLSPQTFTVSAWAQPLGTGSNNDYWGNVIVSKALNGNYASMSITWRPSDQKFLLFYGDIVTQNEIVTSQGSFPIGNYYHVVARYDGVTFELFVNGTLQGQAQSTRQILYSSIPWSIGSNAPVFRSQGFFRSFNGAIDDVRIYQGALSVAEIQALANQPIPNEPPITNPDSTSTLQETPVTVNVLANDLPGPSYELNQSLVVTAASSANGTVEIQSDSSLRFTPANGFVGATTIEYTIQDRRPLLPLGTKVLPASYSMPNGQSGQFNYWDETYSPGPPSYNLQPLSGGRGQLTDGIIATANWSANSYPYVAWYSEPTIQFFFDNQPSLSLMRIHFDDSNGHGGVFPPDAVELTTSQSATRVLPVPDPVSGAPFAFDIPLNGLSYQQISIKLIQTRGWAFISEVEFFGPSNNSFTSLSATGTVQVNVTPGNQAPVLGFIPSQTVIEQSELSVTAIATDANLPNDVITYSLVNPPAGVTIHSSTGVILWTPTEAQGPSSYVITVRATDLAGAFDEESFSVQVNEVNVPPTIPAIARQTAFVGQPFTLTVAANDVDLPANALSYSLTSAPTGMQIDSSTGVVTWNPSANDPFGLYSIVVSVTDNGTPLLSATRTVEIALRDPDALYVTHIGDSGVGSLRQAILTSNTRPGRDKIWFDIPGTSTTIAPGTQLPSITDPVDLDATTQPGYTGTPLIQISGHNAVGIYYGQPIYGLSLESGQSMVRGLLISSFAVGIGISGPGGNVIQSNYLGTNGVWDGQIGNVTNLSIVNSPNNLIGGSTPQTRNIISGARDGGGIYVTGSGATGNRIHGNYVGLSSDGTYVITNRYHNIIIDNAPGNFIGGIEPGQGNVIGGANSGIAIGGAGSIGNIVAGNYIGFNPAETHNLNTSTGISLSNAVDTIVGGDTPGASNRIGFTHTAIALSGGSGNRVLGNRIGVATDGRNFGNSVGIAMYGTSNATIGGNTEGSSNVIGHNGYGIYALYDNNSSQVKGNKIGLLADETTFAPNSLGIIVQSGSNITIGGLTASEANTIGGNSFAGIGLYETNNIRIVGNNIGVASDGQTSRSNSRGIYITYATNGLQIGGTDAADRNVISGNALGIEVEGVWGSNNRIQGNAIGTTRSGDASVAGSGTGITMTNGSQFLIGGPVVGAGNVISGNTGHGIRLQGSTNNIVIQGNRIGTNEAGTAGLGNSIYGITLLDTSSNILVGGVTALERNMISGNGQGGLNIWGPKPSTRVIGNFVGTDVTGTVAIPNQGFGVLLRTSQIEVGGTQPNEANLISGNQGPGIHIFQSTSSLIFGNQIGTDVTGAASLGNSGHGIQIDQESRVLTIGGPLPGQGNTIRFNGLDGVSYFDYFGSATGVLLRGNSIDNNGGFAFDLDANDRVEGSDFNDWDDGANRLLNPPVLTGASSGASTVVTGTYYGVGALTLTLDFYASPQADPSGYGEGRRYLGAATFVTALDGTGGFSVTLPVATSAGESVSATASILSSYFTSEYSNAVVSVNSNNAPTDIVLSNTIVTEQSTLGTTVGTFSAVDQDLDDTHLFSFAAGAGDTDNAAFTIVGNQLRTNATVDYLTKSQYSIRVRATDEAGDTTEKEFAILVRYIIRSTNLYVDPLGNLIVNGTNVHDNIELTERTNAPGTFDVLFNRSFAVIGGVTGIVKAKLLSGDDRFVLNSTRDSEIEGNDGNDVIFGGEGTDAITGGRGTDTLAGRGGNDTFRNEFDFGLYDNVDGGTGFDTIVQNRDWHRFTSFTPSNGIESLTIMNPNNGTRRVQGEGVSDNTLDFSGITHINGVSVLNGLGLDIRGLGGNDIIVGTLGDDTISGGDGDDTISGLDGHDTLNGNAGIDSIDGGLGNDLIDGGTGIDTTLGGEGDDVFIANFSDHVYDLILGGNGTNAIRLNPGRNQSDPIVLNSFTPANQIQQLQGGSRVAGTSSHDTLDFSAVTAWTTGRRIDGGDGDDLVKAPSGIAGFSINGGAGRDTIFGSDLNDVIDGGLDDDIIDALAGDDLVRGGAGFNQMTGGLGSDTFFFHDIIEGQREQQIVDFQANDFLKFQWPVNQTLLYGTAPVSQRFVWDIAAGVLYLPNGRRLTLSIGLDLLQTHLLFGNW